MTRPKFFRGFRGGDFVTSSPDSPPSPFTFRQLEHFVDTRKGCTSRAWSWRYSFAV